MKRLLSSSPSAESTYGRSFAVDRRSSMSMSPLSNAERSASAAARSAVRCSVLIRMEAPASAYRRGTAGAGQRQTTSRGGDLRRFYRARHQAASPCEHSSSRLIRQPCPYPSEAVRIAPYRVHEIKLGGDMGEWCGGATPPRSQRHGR
jgi:hypothetical protein